MGHNHSLACHSTSSSLRFSRSSLKMKVFVVLLLALAVFASLASARSHRGSCPEVRRSCPGGSGFDDPRFCGQDGNCGRSEKCCEDACIKSSFVCKGSV